MALILHVRTKTLLNIVKKIRQVDAERDAVKARHESFAINNGNSDGK